MAREVRGGGGIGIGPVKKQCFQFSVNGLWTDDKRRGFVEFLWRMAYLS